jgi:beta-N-acetylhexosaminidase
MLRLLLAISLALTSVMTPARAQTRDISSLLRDMTLEQKVGQLFLVFAYGTELSPSLARAIREYNIGGVVLFQGNIVEAAQVARLTNAAQSVALESGAKVPLWVAIDQEGGLVQRLPPPAPVVPSQMAVAATGDVRYATRLAEGNAAAMKAIGVNMVLAPVLDVNDNPANPIINTRAFATRADQVADYGTAMIAAYRQAGLLAVAKHFPGHGNTAIDSHFGLPTVSKSAAELEAVELAPFKRAVAAGVDAMMTAHIVFPALEPDRLPATLSKRILNGLLRERFGYTGLIVSDSMTMDAIDRNYGLEKATLMAFEAGVDIIAVGADIGTTPNAYRREYRALVEAIRGAPALQRRLDDSVRRILQAKARYGVLDFVPVDAAAAPARLANPAFARLLAEIAAKSVTVLRDPSGRLPVPAEGRLLVIAPRERDRLGTYTADALRAAFGRCGTRVEIQLTSINPTAGEIRTASAAAQDAVRTVVVTLNVRAYGGQARLARTVPGAIVAAIRNPYDADVLPVTQTVITTYSDVPVSLDALAGLLCG